MSDQDQALKTIDKMTDTRSARIHPAAPGDTQETGKEKPACYRILRPLIRLVALYIAVLSRGSGCSTSIRRASCKQLPMTARVSRPERPRRSPLLRPRSISPSSLSAP